MNQAKILIGSLSLLLVAVAVSCTRNLSVPVTAVVNTPTPTSTKTALATSTPTVTNTPSGPTSTFTNTFTPTFTATSTPTFTGTSTNTPTGPTATFTNTGTSTNTPTITNTFTFTDTATITNTPTLTATFTNTGTYTNTPTPTNTAAAPPTSTPTTNEDFNDFDEAPWTGWTSGGSNGYLASVYTQACTDNGGTVITTTTKDGTAGAVDYNETFTAPSSNLFEVTLLNGASYGGNVNEQYGGVNPTYVSYWVYTTAPGISTAKVFIDNSGTDYSIPIVVSCPSGVWTNVVATIPGTVPAMTAVKATIHDFTSTVAETVDIIIDSVSFYQ